MSPIVPLAHPLHRVDLLIGFSEPLNKFKRNRLIASRRYPQPIFEAAGQRLVLARDVQAFLDEAREHADEAAAKRAARGARLSAAKAAKATP
jgi:hypothetical protein